MVQNHTHDWLRYFLLAVLAWVIVGFTTTAAIGNPVAYYSGWMPALLIFYVGYPLVFTALIYKFRLGSWALLLAMIAGIFVVEIVAGHNMPLLALPGCLLLIPISLGQYGMVTFVPMWIAERTIGQNRKWAAAMLVGWAFGVFLNIRTQFGSHQGSH